MPTQTNSSDALPKLSAPAHRALASIGVKSLSDLSKFSEADLLKLHGFGQSAIKSLRAAGVQFAGEVNRAASVHPLVTQLRFVRSEFARALRGLSDEDAAKRLMPMNCISWNVGHLAWQEQRYFLQFAQGQMLRVDVNEQFAYGCPASTPSLKAMLSAWKQITKATDAWLDTLTSSQLLEAPIVDGKPIPRQYGNLLNRTIYHYWYHTGENMAIRQMLGHTKLAVFVGNIDNDAPYRPEQN